MEYIEKWTIYNIHYIATALSDEYINIVAKNFEDAYRIAKHIEKNKNSILRIVSISEDKKVLKYNI